MVTTMLSVGLTGGIGAGKSAVATRLARHGAVLIDSDVLAREVVAPGTAGLAEVVAAFGDRVVGPGGALDRPALGALVFGSPEARRTLEGIVHPRVRARSAELAAAAPPGSVVLHDVPLLVEVGLAPAYRLVVVVEANRDVRIARLVRDRGMTADQAAARIAAQADDTHRRAAADVLLRNDHDRAALHRAADTLWRRLQEYAHNLHARTVPDPDPAIVPADPRWPAQAARIAARLRHALGDVPIAHVGRTAVPGLPAADILDLLLAVPPAGPVSEVAGLAVTPPGLGHLEADLARLGFPAVPDGPAGGDERLHGASDPGRPIRLHVMPVGSPGWRTGLLLRDHLRADPAAREALRSWPARSAPGRWFDRDEALHADLPAARRWAAESRWSPPES
jgi:dephospho-CoA kinase